MKYRQQGFKFIFVVLPNITANYILLQVLQVDGGNLDHFSVKKRDLKSPLYTTYKSKKEKGRQNICLSNPDCFQGITKKILTCK